MFVPGSSPSERAETGSGILGEKRRGGHSRWRCQRRGGVRKVPISDRSGTAFRGRDFEAPRLQIGGT